MRCVRVGIEQLDTQLATLAREETALRLRLGQMLEVLGRGGVFELGFSSLSAYALERCDRSVRWAEAARCLARRVEGLPELRRAMAAGRLSWSMADLLARVAQPEDEVKWLEAAESRTVRQMRVLVAEAVAVHAASFGAASFGAASLGAAAHDAAAHDAAAHDAAAGPAGGSEWAEGEGNDAVCTDPCSEMNALSCTVSQEEAWLFEATRLLLEQMGVLGADAQSEALLAEGQATLLATLPEGVLDLERLEGNDVAQRRWVRELGRWRVEAEALCEDRFCGSLWSSRDQRFCLKPSGGGRIREEEVAPGVPEEGVRQQTCEPRSSVAAAAARGMASLGRRDRAALDGQVRALSQMLAQHELDVSRLVLQLHREGGWRRLGYATEAQYARERLGWSISSLRGRRSLGLRLERLPCVAEALGVGQLGVEAALQVVRVATVRTEAAWVERALRRTVKHLREEVAAALVARRCSGEVDCVPPLDVEMMAFKRLEQAVVSGRVCRGEAASVANDNDRAVGGSAKVLRLAEPTSPERRAWFVMLSSLGRWLEGGLQLSAGSSAERPEGGARRGASAGRVTLRLRMSRSACTWWRGLEAQARRWLPEGMSWLRFLCLSMWQAWQHRVGASVAYSKIYERDGYRCLSPVCNRRDVTPHHIRFRSAGGSDDAENVGSICTWCHLEGVHGGRIRATGTAGLIHWEIGAGSPCLIVHGRDRLGVPAHAALA